MVNLLPLAGTLSGKAAGYPTATGGQQHVLLKAFNRKLAMVS